MICFIVRRSVRLRSSCNALFNQWQNIPKLCVRWSSATALPSPVVFQKASKFQDSTALIDNHGEHTYGQILNLSGHLAKLMQDVLGKERLQQRVAFLCPNDVSYVITQWATWMAGHIAVPLYPKHPSAQLEYFVRDSESSVIVTTTELTQKIKPILSGQQVIVLEDFFFKPFPGKNENTEEVKTEEYSTEGIKSLENGLDEKFYSVSDAMIIYTSGTTGPPKGVVLTHNNILSQMSCLHKAWGWSSGDTILHCLPLHHVHGIVNALLCPLYVGARVIMLPEFSAATVWNQLLSLNTPVNSRVNLFMAVPTMYSKLIEEYERKIVKNNRMREYVKAVCMQNIRLMVSGSAALPDTVLEQWRLITGHTLLERYGMTEIGMALSNPLKGSRKPGFVGNPLPDVEVCIAKFQPGKDEYQVLCQGNSQGSRVLLKPGDGDEVSGELLVRGPNVFKEYWKNPKATAKEFTYDRWFRTGDTAQYTQGSYRILGRTSVDIIKSGGFKISALDVERHLITHPNILDVAVVGIPDITWGQKVAAVIHWFNKESFDPLKLKAWCRELMPHYQVPSVIVTVSKELPRNNMGKVNKKQILKDFFLEAK